MMIKNNGHAIMTHTAKFILTHEVTYHQGQNTRELNMQYTLVVTIYVPCWLFLHVCSNTKVCTHEWNHVILKLLARKEPKGKIQFFPQPGSYFHSILRHFHQLRQHFMQPPHRRGFRSFGSIFSMSLASQRHIQIQVQFPSIKSSLSTVYLSLKSETNF